jgi:hypothetical protein
LKDQLEELARRIRDMTKEKQSALYDPLIRLNETLAKIELVLEFMAMLKVQELQFLTEADTNQLNLFDDSDTN